MCQNAFQTWVGNNGKDGTFEEAKQKNQTTKKLRDKDSYHNRAF
jgi:hypothetical protein